jgi:hypothetical protein
MNLSLSFAVEGLAEFKTAAAPKLLGAQILCTLRPATTLEAAASRAS